MNIVKISGQYIFMYVCTYVSCTGNHYEVYLNFHISLKPMSLKNVGAIFLLATRFVNFTEEQKTSPYKDKSRKIADIDFFLSRWPAAYLENFKVVRQCETE